MNKMIVAVFNNETAAFEGLSALKDLHKDGDTRCTRRRSS